MKIENIEIGEKRYKVEVPENNEEMLEGLQNRNTLGKLEGMLFIFPESKKVSMWMRDTKIPLDIIYINEDLEVIDVKQGIPEDDTLLSVEDTMYVVELNKGSGVKVGDELEFIDSSEYVMDVLAPDGSSQFKLKGGERIFSRKATKVILRKALKAKESLLDKDFKSLGRYIFKEMSRLDNRDPEFVKAPN